MPEVKPTAEESFRESLSDVIVILQRLVPYCNTLDEAIGMITLAGNNDAQLRLLMNIVTAPAGKR